MFTYLINSLITKIYYLHHAQKKINLEEHGN